MPTCSEAYGPGWVGEHPNCRYEASTPGGGQGQVPFTGTVESLGYGDILAGSSWADDWQKFFDPYDPRGEEMATRKAGIDVGQLESAWGLQEEQLGEAWGFKGAQLGETLGLGREQLGETWRLQEGGLGEQWGGQRQELGAGARGAFQDVERMIAGMTQKGRGLGFGEQRRRQAEEEVSGAYKRSFGLGQSAYERAIASGQSRYTQGLEAQTLGYEQAMETGQMGYEQALETGQLGLQQGRTDIYQGLESDIFGQREDYLGGQRSTLNMLLGSGIWAGGDGGDDYWNTGAVTCCDGSSQPAAYMCGAGNAPGQCYGDKDGSVGGTGTGTDTETGGAGGGTGGGGRPTRYPGP